MGDQASSSRRGDDSVWQLLADEAWKLSDSSGGPGQAMNSLSSPGARSGGQAAGPRPGHEGTEAEGSQRFQRTLSRNWAL